MVARYRASAADARAREAHRRLSPGTTCRFPLASPKPTGAGGARRWYISGHQSVSQERQAFRQVIQ